MILSEDGGTSWELFDNSLPNPRLGTVAFAGDRLVVATDGSGYFWLPPSVAVDQPGSP